MAQAVKKAAQMGFGFMLGLLGAAAVGQAEEQEQGAPELQRRRPGVSQAQSGEVTCEVVQRARGEVLLKESAHGGASVLLEGEQAAEGGGEGVCR